MTAHASSATATTAAATYTQLGMCSLFILPSLIPLLVQPSDSSVVRAEKQLSSIRIHHAPARVLNPERPVCDLAREALDTQPGWLGCHPCPNGLLWYACVGSPGRLWLGNPEEISHVSIRRC